MTFEDLHYIYEAAAHPEAYTLLLLHGTGGDETDLLPLASGFDRGVNILGVRGNTSENGMPRFFKRKAMGVFDEEDLEFRARELVAFLKKLAAEKGFDSDRIVALGYSNGANIAGAVLMLFPDFLAGAILLRPMQPFRDFPDFKTKKNIPVFISYGKFDTMVNPSGIEAYVRLLRLAGFDVDSRERSTGHHLDQDDIALAVLWFNDKILPSLPQS